MSKFLECHYHYQGHSKQIGNQQGLQLNSIEPICGWETMQFIEQSPEGNKQKQLLV